MKNMRRELEPQLNNKKSKRLYNVLAKISKSDEMAAFLRDLLTIEEIEEMVRRFEVAELLSKGMTTRVISKKTKMSSATISRINYWLHHGMGGYGLALEKLK